MAFYIYPVYHLLFLFLLLYHSSSISSFQSVSYLFFLVFSACSSLNSSLPVIIATSLTGKPIRKLLLVTFCIFSFYPIPFLSINSYIFSHCSSLFIFHSISYLLSPVSFTCSSVSPHPWQPSPSATDVKVYMMENNS